MAVNFKKLNIGRMPKVFDKDAKKNMTASEKVYANVVVKKILPMLELENINPNSDLEKYLAASADGKMAIDHFVKDKEGTLVTVQSRFRAPRYGKYNDFTIRYDKPSSKSYTGETVKCEFNHFNADTMFYGICDYDLLEDADKVTRLNKWVFVNVVKFRELCKNDKIVPIPEGGKCRIEDGKLLCPLQKNTGEKDTRFVAVDVKLANELFPDLLILQKGYL